MLCCISLFQYCHIRIRKSIITVSFCISSKLLLKYHKKRSLRIVEFCKNYQPQNSDYIHEVSANHCLCNQNHIQNSQLRFSVINAIKRDRSQVLSFFPYPCWNKINIGQRESTENVTGIFIHRSSIGIFVSLCCSFQVSWQSVDFRIDNFINLISSYFCICCFVSVRFIIVVRKFQVTIAMNTVTGCSNH
jgi:hypothetical protein